MPGNRAIFDRAMEQSREAARKQQWDEALKGAVRALQEFPQDTDGRTSAAVALFHIGKLAQALQIFQELRATDAQNPFFLAFIAQAYERQGNIEAAVETYGVLADLHQSQRVTARTIEALREILRLRPDLDDQRQRLAGLLQESNATREAATEYFVLARRHFDQGHLDDAAANAETALRFDANNREAKELMVAIRDAMARAAQADPVAANSPASDVRLPKSSMTSSLRSQQFTLEKIVALAIEKQEAGDIDGAIEQYERATQAGLERADVLYSLGLLYQEKNNHQAAVQVLAKAANDPEYALSAHFALGSAYKELNQLQHAAQEYEQTIGLVDLESIGRAEVEDLIQMYESAVEIYEQIGDIARAASLFSTLASFLQTRRWGKERAAEFNRRAKELTERNMFAKLRTLGTGGLTSFEENDTAGSHVESEAMPESWGKIRSITDFLRSERVESATGNLGMPDVPAPSHADPLTVLDSLPVPATPAFAPVTKLDITGLDEQTGRWVMASEKYIEQNLLEAAIDACLEVIRFDVDYLPIHLRIGEIYERQSRQEDALTKYQLLIDTYAAQREADKSIDVYYRLIELSPDTINARSRLAELLKNAGRIDAACDQLAYVATTYFRLGQNNRALEEFRRLLQWSPKNSDLHGQYGLALFKMDRFEAALGEFRKAIELGAANDVVAVTRLNMTLAVMGEYPVAVWDSLAALLDLLKKQPQYGDAVQSEYRAALLTADEAILHYILGIVQQGADQHGSALMEFEQAQALLEADEDPMLPLALVYQAMSDSYIALGQAEDALAQLRKGQAVAHQVKTDPAIKHAFAVPLSPGDLTRRMAEAYAASDDLEGAEKALLEARRLLPYDRAIYTKLADVYFRQGKLHEALVQLEDLASHYEKRQDLDRAIETLEYGLKLAPNNTQVGSRLARLYIRRGLLDKGLDSLVRVAELQRKAGQLKDAVANLQQAADVYWTLGKQDDARVLYDKITQIAPNDVEARQWLALMYTLSFRTADAVAEKKQIVRILTQQRDYENAIAELHQIIGLDQKDLDAYYLLGDMLMRREEYIQAVSLYNRMLKIDGADIDRIEALISAANHMLLQR